MSTRTSLHVVQCVAAGIPVKGNAILHHPYQADPQSGAGNCVCGRHDGHGIHTSARGRW